MIEMRSAPFRPLDSPYEIGQQVFGPILAEFALRLWAFGSNLPKPENAKLLFCARGGLRLKLLFEDFLGQCGLTLPLPFDHIMISRLVAARPALLRREDAAMDELSREFEGARLCDVALALTQTNIRLGAAWDQPFSRSAFLARLWADDRDSEAIVRAIELQHDLFRRHFDARRGHASEVILCDTGLNGSTLKLLSLGMPDVDLSCALFARGNYKGFDTSHFRRTVGLSIERDAYSIFNRRTSLFRYWQLFEHVLEPNLPSVRTFTAHDKSSEPTSNLEIDGWRKEIAPDTGDIFAGSRSYIQGLDPSKLTDLFKDARVAWSKLGRLITRPTPSDVHLLRIGDRSRDFGRTETVPAFTTKRGGVSALDMMKDSFWKEGHVAVAHPTLRHVIFIGLEGAYLVRPLARRLVSKLSAIIQRVQKKRRLA